MIDLDQERLEVSKNFGATDTVNSGTENAVEAVKKLVGEQGVDVAIEAVGIPATFYICQKLLKPGGHLANVGVHGKPVELHIEELWIRNVTITMGLVCTSTTSMLLKNIESKKLQPEKLVSHRFDFSDMINAYEVFGNAAKEKALKVIINFN